MAVKRIIVIMGKTRSGKDTLSNLLQTKYGVIPICSYTTRKPRDNEVDGREHHFITQEEMNKIKSTKHLIGYTMNDETKIEYCATSEDIKDDKWYSYILNPNGLRYMYAHYLDKAANQTNENFFFYVIYVRCAEEILKTRGEGRNDDDVFLQRILSERDEFDDFYKNYKHLINTTIMSDQFPKEKFCDVAESVMDMVEASYADYMHCLDVKPCLVSKFLIGEENVSIKKINGKEISRIGSVKEILNDARLFKKPLYIMNEYPDTVIDEDDIDSTSIK